MSARSAPGSKGSGQGAGKANSRRVSNKPTQSSGRLSGAANKAAPSGSARSRDARGSSRLPEEPRAFLEPQVRSELIGVVFCVLAVALLIALVAPGNALLTRAVSTACRMACGLGAFLLPFLIAAWGVSFFIREKMVDSVVRLTVGIVLIFVAALALVAMSTPGISADLQMLFEPENLADYGGYLGGSLAWLLLKLVGYAVGAVVAIGAIIAGAVLVGLSLSALAARIVGLFRRDSDVEADDGTDVQGMGPYQLDFAETDDSTASKRSRRRLWKGKGEPEVLLAPTARLAESFGGGADGQAVEDASVSPTVSFAPSQDAALGQTRRRGRAAASGQNGYKATAADSAEQPPDSDAVTELLDPERAVKPQDKAVPSAATGGTADHARDGVGAPEKVKTTGFVLPSMALLQRSRSKSASKAAESELRNTAAELQGTLAEFAIDAQVVGWTAGPTVTLYKLALGEGVRVARITSLADDIALALAATSVRVFSPIPGTSLVGVEVPNAERSTVLLGDVLSAAPSGALQLAVGKDVEGDAIVANLIQMPHLLIGGTTGSGKSVAINAMIMSVLMRATPAEVRMILIDPKMVELTRYHDIPHLYVPVVTDAGKAAAALAWSVIEMERRLKEFMTAEVKNISTYNEYVRNLHKKAEAEAAKRRQKAQEAWAAAADAALEAARPEDSSSNDGGGLDRSDSGAAPEVDAPEFEMLEEYGEALEQDDDYADVADAATPMAADDNAGQPGSGQDACRLAECSDQPEVDVSDLFNDLPEEMPLIMIVIDELADLMMVAGKDVEASITRLSQLARAAGLHLVIATQRPSTNVITGVIKANIVNRIAFNVGSGIDSRVILDTTGAEALLGIGDLLFSRPEYGKPVRIQGCFVNDAEIGAVTSFLKQQGTPDYHEEILTTAVGGISTSQIAGFDAAGDDDPLVWEAAEIVVSSQLGSTSTLQRRLKVGYARAGRIMDNLEQKGIVGPANGSKPREVMVDDLLELESLKALEAADRDDSW